MLLGFTHGAGLHVQKGLYSSLLSAYRPPQEYWLVVKPMLMAHTITGLDVKLSERRQCRLVLSYLSGHLGYGFGLHCPVSQDTQIVVGEAYVPECIQKVLQMSTSGRRAAVQRSARLVDCHIGALIITYTILGGFLIRDIV